MVGVRKFNEEHALNKALQVFWEKGLGPTTMQDISDATGVQRGSLYNAYQTKEEIFLLAYERYRESMLSEARSALDKPAITTALRSFFSWTISSMTTGEPTRGCLTTKTATDLVSENEIIRAALRQFLEELESVLRERCEKERNLGTLHVDPAAAAQVLVTYSRGIVIMERIYQDPVRLKSLANSLINVLVVKP